MQRSKGSENINAIIESVESRNNNSQQQQQQQCNSNNSSQKNTRRSLSTSRIPSRNKSYIGGGNDQLSSPLAAFDLKNFPYAGFTRLDDILSPKSSERSSSGERYCSYSQTSIKFPSPSSSQNQNSSGSSGNVMLKDGFKLLLGETKGQGLLSTSSATRTTSNVNNFEPENQRITLKKVKPLLHIRSSSPKSPSKDLNLKSGKRPASSYSSQDEIETLSTTPLLSPNKNSPRIQMSTTNGNSLLGSGSSTPTLNPIPSQNKELNSNYLLKPAVKSLNYNTQSDSSIKQMSSSNSNSSQNGNPSNSYPSYHNRSASSTGNVANQTQIGSNQSQHQQSIRKVASTSGHFPMIEKHQQNKKHSSSINVSGNSSSNNKGSNDSNLLSVDINKNSHTSKYHVPKGHSSNVSTCSSSSNPSLSSPTNSSKKVKNKSSISLVSFRDSEETPPTSSNEQRQQTMVEDLSRQIKNLIKENITLSKKVTFYENRDRDREKNSGESKLSLPSIDRGKASKSSLVGQNLDKTIIINDNHKAIENNQLKGQVDTLKYQNDKLKDENKLLTLENQKINKLLRDILYTLNARGFETLSDGHGNTIDLNRCKGETLLEMRGRDTRNRTGVRKNSPQELLLKAVIGSQERLIQNLVTQLDTTQSRQRDLANGQPIQGQNPYNTPGSRGDVDQQQQQETATNANDGDVLALINVIEAICMRSQEVFFTLKDYLEAEYRERNVANILLENVLGRCEKYNMLPEHSLQQPQTQLPRLVRSKMKSNKRMHQNQNDPKSNGYNLMPNQQLVPRGGRPMSNRPQPTMCQLSHQQQHQHQQHHHHQMQQSQHLKMPKVSNENFQHLPAPSTRYQHQNPHPRDRDRDRVNRPFPCLNSFPMLKIIDGSESNGYARGASAPGTGTSTSTISGNNHSTTMISSNSPRPKHKIKSESGNNNGPRNPASSSSHMIGHSHSHSPVGQGQGQHQQYQFQHEEQRKPQPQPPHVCQYCHKIFDHDTPQSQITAHYDLHFFKRTDDNNNSTPTPTKPSTS